MTDVESKTPTKRKIVDKDDKKGPAKKGKFAPKLQNKPANKHNLKLQNKASNKLNNVPNNNQKAKKNKKGNEGENGSLKKLKPFVGTSAISTSKVEGKKGNKAVKTQNEEGEKKKPRKNFFLVMQEKLKSEEKQSTLEDIKNKIKAIESRNEISKTAKRKLRVLNKLKNIAEGNFEQAAQRTVDGNKSATKSRQDRKKSTDAAKLIKTGAGKKESVTVQAKSMELKINKNTKLQNKQVAKKVKVEVEELEESDDEFNKSEDESDDEEGSGADQEIDDEGESEEDSDEDGDEDEEESDENEDQTKEESAEDESEEEQSDEDESEEESPPQVSNKKQKKK